MFTIVVPQDLGVTSFYTHVSPDKLAETVARNIPSHGDVCVVHGPKTSLYLRSISNEEYSNRLSCCLRVGDYRGIFWSVEEIRGDAVRKAHRTAYKKLQAQLGAADGSLSETQANKLGANYPIEDDDGVTDPH